eukprot:474577_1
MTSHITKHKNQRKQRILKNTIIDVDNVSVEPGNDYENWVEITRTKLKQRESALLSVKRRRIEEIINNELINCNRKYIIPQLIIDNTLTTLHIIINQWKGVDVARRKKIINRYRDYFSISKNWFDQRKKKKMGSLFWVKLFKHIHNFLDQHNLLMFELKVTKELFEGKVKYSNTKPLPVINGGTIMCSKEMHQYLFNLHNTLQIKEWIENQEHNGNYKNISFSIIEKIRLQLNIIVNNNTNNNTQMVNAVNAHCIHNSQQSEHNSHNSHNVYNGYHSQSHTFSDFRYSPMVPVQNTGENNYNLNLPVIVIVSPLQFLLQ